MNADAGEGSDAATTSDPAIPGMQAGGAAGAKRVKDRPTGERPGRDRGVKMPARPSPEAPAAAGPPGAAAAPSGRKLFALAAGALGIVYGDIGTSPLYAMRECFHGEHAVEATRANVVGVLSLILWSLVVVVSVKYLVFVLRADNRGEGGILALASLVTPMRAGAKAERRVILTLGLFGAALLYADGMITPAISVLSAVEGLEVAAPALKPYVAGITVAILVGLFLFQSRGTAGVGRVFGPVIAVWFAVLAALGAWHLAGDPGVLAAVNPVHAIGFFARNGAHGFLVLGSVFLVVTGGEALYADIGHFGVRPIRLTWFAVVLPALLIHYFGQGAFLIEHPEGASNPFYRMAPGWALYPLVALATAATVIASQAVITGAFSLTLQAVQLGYFPRVTIYHTNRTQRGQIYIPAVNWALMAACVALVLGFGSSSRLAAAYGVAITITMVITTVLFFVLASSRWKWALPVAAAVSGTFLVVDLAFFGANAVKVADGGWFPLLVAAGVFTLMSTWRRGRSIVRDRLRERLVPLETFLAELAADPPARVPGTAVFLFSNPQGTPPALRFNVGHNKVLHETVVILTVETEETPRVAAAERTRVEPVPGPVPGVYRMTARYGFMEEPEIPELLAATPGLPGVAADSKGEAADVSYFLGREMLEATSRPGMALWRERLFVAMSRNAQHATAFFNLPADRVVELGVPVEL